jgi:predicted ATP-grasp superfamily ATP-dependent carboligase
LSGAGDDPDLSTPAVVLKLDRNVFHHGGLGVIRSLGRLGVPVYGIHEDRLAPAAGSRYLHGRYYGVPDPADVPRLLAGLNRLADLIGRPAVLITTDDAGAIFLAEHGPELRGRFLFPSPPAGLPRRLAGKYTLHEMCRQHGFPSPRTVLPDSLAAAREFAAAAGYPVVAKLTAPWRAPARVRSTQLVAGPDALARLHEACARADAGLLLQERIADGEDWFFHGYCDAAARCRPAFTGVKERSYPASAGLTSLGRSAANPELRQRVTTLLTCLGYAGALDLDIRLDLTDGRYHLLDFNPRLGAQFRLFRDTAGTDVALAAYLDLTGQPVPDAPQADGRRFCVENYDPISALAHLRAGDLTIGTWLASLRGTDELAWFARDDMRPFGLMCARMTWRAATRWRRPPPTARKPAA